MTYTVHHNAIFDQLEDRVATNLNLKTLYIFCSCGKVQQISKDDLVSLSVGHFPPLCDYLDGNEIHWLNSKTVGLCHFHWSWRIQFLSGHEYMHGSRSWVVMTIYVTGGHSGYNASRIYTENSGQYLVSHWRSKIYLRESYVPKCESWPLPLGILLR